MRIEGRTEKIKIARREILKNGVCEGQTKLSNFNSIYHRTQWLPCLNVSFSYFTVTGVTQVSLILNSVGLTLILLCQSPVCSAVT